MPTALSAPEAEAATATRREVGPQGSSAVLAMFLCGMFAFVDLYCTQPLLPMLSRVFHASEYAVGLTISASTLGVAISAALLAIFAETADRKRIIVASMGALACCTVMAGTATGLRSLAVWRVLQGLVTPGVFIPAIAYITEEWPAARVPRVMSVYVAGTVFGGFLGRLLGGLLAPALGWRAVFVVLGVVGLAGMGATQLWLRPAERTPRATSRGPSLRPVWNNLRSRPLMATFAVGFCMLFTLVSMFSYVTFYLTAAPFHLSTQQVSYLFAVYLIGLVATLVMGGVLGRIGLRAGMLVAVGLCLSGALLTLVLHLAVVAIGLSLVGAGIFIAQTCANSFLRDAAAEGHRVAAAGMYICAYYIGGTVGGVLPGVVLRLAGWPGCVALTAVFLVLAGLFTFFGWRLPAPEPIPV